MSKKLFIIEDDVNILYSLRAKFSIAGFEVGVNSGGEAEEEILNKIRDFNPDFIILDLILPKVDGFSLLARFKTDSRFSKAPVFIFTNISDKDSKAKGEKLGADYYFIKSDFMIDEFVEKIKKIIANRA